MAQDKKGPAIPGDIFHSLYLYTSLAVIAWLLIIAVSLAWDVFNEKAQMRKLAMNSTLVHFNKDMAVRLWATSHGGIYVPVTEETPPNPYLSHVPERDIVTPAGRRLTLMNPAYVMRQIMEQNTKLYGVRGHITSLKPLNPANAPDAWERRALAWFERGVGEAFEFTEIDNQPYLRMIRPMITTEGCLKCHGQQGYEVGDVRGGVGVAVPMAQFITSSQPVIRKMILSHVVIGGIGLLVIGFFFIRGKGRLLERRIADQALRKSEQILAEAQRIAHIGSWSLDLVGNELQWSAEVYRIFGLSPQEFAATYEAFLATIHPGDRELVERSYAEARDRHIPYEVTHRIVRPDGEVRWVHEKSEEILDADGRTIRSIGTVQDVTELKLAKARITEQDEQVRLLLDSTAEGIYGLDIAGNCTFCNPAALRLLGYERQEELLGRNMHELVHYSRADGTEYPIKECRIYQGFRSQEGAHVDDEVLWRADGSSFNAEYWSYPVRKGRQVVGAVVTFIDISQRVEADLEKTRLLSQLQQAQKMEAVGTLAGGIAHDFNNILAAVLGYAEIAKDNIPIDNPAQGDIDQVIRAADRAKDLIKQILTFSRQTETEQRPIQIQLIVKEALKLLRSSIPANIEIRRNIQDAGGFVLADPTQIHQIIMNLCTNAYHAMRDRNGLLTVNLSTLVLDAEDKTKDLPLGPGPYLVLEVSDTGLGMDRQTIQRIFEPYFTTKKPGEGTGLGLAVVHGIVKSIKGHISVYSEPGAGTTFRVYLPSIVSEAVREYVPAAPVPRGDEHVLVVDDEEQLVLMERRMLEGLGYRVTSFTSSIEALQEFKGQPAAFDLVITDMYMPAMTGVQLTKEILRLRPGQPIILCTGFSESINAEKARMLGIREYVLKPLVKREFATIVRQVLDDKQPV